MTGSVVLVDLVNGCLMGVGWTERSSQHSCFSVLWDCYVYRFPFWCFCSTVFSGHLSRLLPWNFPLLSSCLCISDAFVFLIGSCLLPLLHSAALLICHHWLHLADQARLMSSVVLRVFAFISLPHLTLQIRPEVSYSPVHWGRRGTELCQVYLSLGTWAQGFAPVLCAASALPMEPAPAPL